MFGVNYWFYGRAMTRFVFIFLAYLFLLLALIGVALPGLPTVPFLLLAAWCASKGSEVLHNKLYAHPYLGKLLHDWEKHKAITRKSKITAIIMLLISAVFMFYTVDNRWLLAGVYTLFVCVAGYLVSRPESTSDSFRNSRKSDSELH